AASAAPAAPVDDITLGQFAKGVLAAAPCAALEAAGVTSSALLHLPSAVCEVSRALYYDDQHGPVLKSLAATMLPAGIGIGLAITGLAAFGYGAMCGALDAAQHGVRESFQNRVQDVRDFDKKVTSTLLELKADNDAKRDAAAPPPAHPAPAPAPAPAAAA
ncbi:MAG: hypothetical protein FJX76_14575, partial [Armatimonadetes bacterium]|nr:hypothetical protein [Armatimonadota bacterium]